MISKNKICFTAMPMGQLDSVICFSKQNVETKIENEQTAYKKYFDVATWLNTGKVIKKIPKDDMKTDFISPFKLVENK